MFTEHIALPFLTGEIPGTGGAVRRQPEDFRVTELPAYEPLGEGDHVYVTIEKRGVTTAEAINRLARAVRANPRDVGSAGLKDRHAVTTQRLSFPPPCTPEALLAAEIDDVRVLAAVRHPHKLRTGHLRGNRFAIRIVDVDTDADTAAERAAAVLERLAHAPGSPNWYGEQRFGARGDNPAAGRALVAGDAPPGGRQPKSRAKRLMISAYQSLLFNEFLRRRIADGLYDRVLVGDLLQRTDSGGVFASSEPDVDQPRLERGEVVPTGPMYGYHMKTPPAGTAAAARESALLEEEGLTLDSFRRVGKLARGTRRPLAVSLGEFAVAAAGERTIEVSFTLPAGSYATAVMREIVKGTTT